MTQHPRCIGPRPQRGVVLIAFVLVLVFIVLGIILNQLNASSLAAQRDQVTAAVLTHAKDALIGYAATYRETHTNQVLGYLPCPDLNGDGEAETTCGSQSVSVIGRLPWKTLGLSPLRDGSSECLWYAVSGSAKNNPNNSVMNWDTPGQFIVQDADGHPLAGQAAHDRPWAIVFAPRNPIGSQSPASPGDTECGGSEIASDYLEMLDTHWADTNYTGDTTIKLSNAASTRSETNNDRALWISAREIFDRIKKRADFRTDIDGLMTDLSAYLNSLPPTSLPSASGAKGVDKLVESYYADNTSLPEAKRNMLRNWQDNLLYTGPSGGFTVNGSPTTCAALLIFGGERTTRTSAPTVAQTRITALEKGDSSMYLEGANVLFPSAGNYTTATHYDAAHPEADIALCINGLSAGATTTSFASPADFSRFVPTGVGVTVDTTSTPASPTVQIVEASGGGGGCFWFSIPVPLAGRTLRAYHEFEFLYSDAYALLPTPIPPNSPPDRGNGFTLQMVRSDIGIPTTCGTEASMGALTTSDMWGSLSYLFETDIHRDITRQDPAGNHTSIMTNGNLTHATNTVSSSCDGSRSGCLHSPADKFEESPTTRPHNQRIEITTGCNSGCSSCDQTNPPASEYAKIATWVDCENCNDVVTNLNRTQTPPTVQSCTRLNVEMNAFYFGFTGGFRSGATVGAAPAQGVTIRNFSLRSE